MKKVFQTVIDRYHGNCMQAVVASLFELDLEDVPNFIEEENWFWKMSDFYEERGYHLGCVNGDLEYLKRCARYDGGVNGYFDGTVNSKIFEGGTHAVVVDMDMNIVHDPNPNGVYLDCKPEDVIAIMCTKDFITGKTGKIFSHEEWDKLSEEEKNENTYKASLEEISPSVKD